MRVYIPIYYEKFKCIADRCKHNCCIGWDVEIDKETYNQYLLKNGNLGEKIRRNIYIEDENGILREINSYNESKQRKSTNKPLRENFTDKDSEIHRNQIT